MPLQNGLQNANFSLGTFPSLYCAGNQGLTYGIERCEGSNPSPSEYVITTSLRRFKLQQDRSLVAARSFYRDRTGQKMTTTKAKIQTNQHLLGRELR